MTLPREQEQEIRMIGSLGDGTFAVLLTCVVALVLALIGSYLFPSAALYISLLCLSLPFIVFAILVSAPRVVPKPAQQPTSPFYNDPPMSTDAVLDSFYGLRVALVALMSFGIAGGVGYHIGVTVLQAPPFTAPTVQCRRKQLEALHPSWYK